MSPQRLEPFTSQLEATVFPVYSYLNTTALLCKMCANNQKFAYGSKKISYQHILLFVIKNAHIS